MRVATRAWRVPLGARATAQRQTDGETSSSRAGLAVVVDREEREAAAAQARLAFCLRLKSARERAGISLTAIAESTKIAASHFAALERNDFARWPGGIYRRAFIRDYAAAVGLPVESTVEEFLALFPDVAQPTPSAAASVSPLRLTLAGSQRRQYSTSYALSAAIDLAAVLLTAAFVTWFTGLGFAVAIAVVALCYYPLSAALLGSSLTFWWLHKPAQPRKFRLLRNRGATDAPARNH